MLNIDTIVGLGNCGTNIAYEFEKNGSYKCLYINTEFSNKFKNNEHIIKINEPNVETYKKHEKYDEMYVDISNFDFGKEVLLIVGGSGKISGCCSWILKQLKECTNNVHVLYIFPDVNFLTKMQKYQHNVVYGILQEWSRSGKIGDFSIISQEILEKLIPNLTLKNKFNIINYRIFYIIDQIIKLNKKENFMGTVPQFSEHFKISTFGVMDMSGVEKKFFNLYGNIEKHYFYSISQNELENNENLISEVKQVFKEKLNENDTITFSVSENDSLNTRECIVFYKTSEIQKNFLTD